MLSVGLFRDQFYFAKEFTNCRHAVDMLDLVSSAWIEELKNHSYKCYINNSVVNTRKSLNKLI